MVAQWTDPSPITNETTFVNGPGPCHDQTTEWFVITYYILLYIFLIFKGIWRMKTRECVSLLPTMQ